MIDFDKKRFNYLYSGSLQYFFLNLRSIKRFLSTFSFHLSLFENRKDTKINFTDLIALEALRVFEPEVYRKISTAKSFLISRYKRNAPSNPFKPSPEIAPIIEKAKEENRRIVQNLLELIFPPTYIPADSKEEQCLAYHHRACHPDFFDRYFLFRLNESHGNRVDIEHLLETAADKKQILNELHELYKHKNLINALNKLETSSQDISLESSTSLISALLDIGDDIPDDGRMFTLSTTQQIERIIHLLLRRENDEKIRGKFLLHAAKEASGIYLLASQAHINDREATDVGRPPGYESFRIDKKSSEDLKALALERIKEAARSHTLLKNPNLRYLLHRWKIWDGIGEPRRWLLSEITEDDGLRSVLIRFLSRSVSLNIERNMENNTEQVRWRFDLESLEIYVDLNDFEACVNQLGDGSLDQMEKIAVDQFRIALSRQQSGQPYGLNDVWEDELD